MRLNYTKILLSEPCCSRLERVVPLIFIDVVVLQWLLMFLFLTCLAVITLLAKARLVVTGVVFAKLKRKNYKLKCLI